MLIENKSACKGDSGGPLLVREVWNNQIKYIVSGIVSYGSICGDQDKPKYFIIFIYFFINQNIIYSLFKKKYLIYKLKYLYSCFLLFGMDKLKYK